MIAFLRGELIERDATRVVLDVAGVGYVFLPTAGALRGLPAVGTETTVPVYMHYTTDGGPSLFGFSDSVERRLFQTLITVKNIGPKAAVNVLSNVPGPDLVSAIVSGDVARLSAVKGVGKKTAERLCVELRDNIANAAAGARKEAAGKRPLPGAGPALDDRVREVAHYLDALQLRPDEYESILPGLDAARPLADLVKDVLAQLREKRNTRTR